jgi:GT2 family glycosyltransferase
MQLSIIIVNYKADKYLKDCLESIDKQDFLETIVVDNNKINRGYGAGCNLGAKKAKGKYLLFLNPDTIVLPGTLKKMVDFMNKNEKVAILGPRIYKNLKKEKQLSYCHFPNPLTALFVFSPIKSLWPNNPLWQKYIYSDSLETKKEFEVEAVSGAALLIRSVIFQKVGGFDENFFLYFEENDLCRRVQKDGGKIIFYPQGEIIHLGGKSFQDSKLSITDFQKSRYYFFKKYFGVLVAFPLEVFIRFLEIIAKA